MTLHVHVCVCDYCKGELVNLLGGNEEPYAGTESENLLQEPSASIASLLGNLKSFDQNPSSGIENQM